MKIKKTVSLMVIGILLLSATQSFAVSGSDSQYMDYGSKTKSTSIRYATCVTSIWATRIDNGRSAWNNSTTGISISKSSTSPNYIYVESYSYDWYGLYTAQEKSGSNVTKYKIQINTRTLTANAGCNFENWAKSTIAHEFGHVFWLADNPSTSRASLMKHDRNRANTTVPQAYDVTSISNKY